MGTETISPYQKRVKAAFLAVALILPLQFYVVYTQGNLYPALFLPAFEPVLDDGEHIHFGTRTLYAVTEQGERIEVSYKAIFNNLTEYHGRHTIEHVFVAETGSEYAGIDSSTKKWLKDRLVAITGRQDIVQFEVEHASFWFLKARPINPKKEVGETLKVKLDD